MTEKGIRKYIDRLNRGRAEETIFTRKISKNVEVAKAWDKPPKKDDAITDFRSYNFFFIKDDSEKYIGAVLDMEQDLHWYIVPSKRKEGYLTMALKEAILPYLFDIGRIVQRITIDRDIENYSSSKNVALSIGFKPIDDEDSQFELKKTDFNWSNERLNEINGKINSERFEILKNRVFYAYKMLYKISDELLMVADDDKGLRNKVDEIRNYTWKIDDIEWENTNNLFDVKMKND